MKVSRIYGFQAADGETLVFVDRLYPRGISKEQMAGVHWLKDIAPSAGLRRWYHAAPQQRFDEFAARYREELQGEVQQAAMAQLRSWQQVGEVCLLTAVKHPQRSHVSVLLEVMGEPFVTD